MAIFSDAAGFKYIGDCQWGTLNMNYPSQSYLEAHPTSSVSAELTSLGTTAGLAFRNVAAQSDFDQRVGSANPLHFLWFGINGDINDRYSFGIGTWLSGNFTSNIGLLGIYDDSGSTNTIPASSFSAINRLYYLGSSVNSVAGTNAAAFGFPSGTISPVYWVGASDGQYLSLFTYQRNFAGNAARTSFFYSGQLADINTGFNYYNANNTTKTISLCQIGGSSVSVSVAGAHYIANAAKNLLQSGDATYTIACSDGQTPGGQWATDMYAFDNNATLGYPAIGKVRGMLLGIGSYTLGKPVKIAGFVFPDGGSPWYLPVGTYAGKTLLMRCYSSVILEDPLP